MFIQTCRFKSTLIIGHVESTAVCKFAIVLDEYGDVGIEAGHAEGLADGRSEHTSFAVINNAD